METQKSRLSSEATQVPSATQPIELTEEQLDAVSGGDNCVVPPIPPAQPGPQPGW